MDSRERQERSVLVKLQLITILDSISYGLIYAFLAPYIILQGADNVIVGLLTVCNLIGELLSEDVSRIFAAINGKRTALFFMFFTAMVSHILLVTTTSYWYTIAARFLFCVTNHSQTLCQDLLLSRDHRYIKHPESMMFNFSILGGIGYLIGPIVAGHVFDHGFFYVAMGAAGLSFLNMFILLTIPASPDDDVDDLHHGKSAFAQSKDRVAIFGEALRSAKIGSNFDLVFVKYLFSGSIIVFFTKYTQIMKQNFESGSISIGYVTAYLNLLIFLSTFYFPTLSRSCGMTCKMRVMRFAFIFYALVTFGACWCPYLIPFLLLCFVVTFLRTFINAIWKSTAKDRGNIPLLHVNNAISVLAGLTVPLAYGIVSNEMPPYKAVAIFSASPPVICFFVLFLFGKRGDDTAEAVSSSSDSDSD